MKHSLFSVALLLLVACNQNPNNTNDEKMNYPQTRMDNTVDTYFGTQVADPYRWLEDDRSAETAQWVKAQNDFTFGYLSKIPYRQAIKEKLEKLWNYEKLSAPFTEGDYTYYYKNDGLQNQSVLYRKDKEGKEEIFLNPNTFSKDGTTSLGDIAFSEDGSLVAYLISEGGSDWRKGIVLDTKTKKAIGDTLVDIKFSSIAWKGNEGFFYSSYDKPKGSELSAKTDQHKLYYHKLGTSQKSDKLIFGGTPAEKYRYVSGTVSNDGKYLFISVANATSGNKLFVKDLSNPKSSLVTITNNFDGDTGFVNNQGTTLFLETNINAPNGRLVKVDFKNPQPEHWQDVIPETKNVLSITTAGKYLFAKYMVDALSQVKQYDYEGKLIREVKLPSIGSAGGFYAKKDETHTYFSFTNYAYPTQIYKMDLATGATELYWKPAIAFDATHYESKQVFYTSKDGTKIPMMITYKKGIELNGKNPTLLYGYGGFNISLMPTFGVANAVWLELGGVYAVPNLRGGGEYGKQWHDAGTKMQKQNVFDDFIAAAEYLIKEKYTSPQYLAIRGGSNGGLLVGATMLQRPDLFKVALPAVGVLDMLRYHTFTAGAGWAYDYGTSDDSKEMFEYLKAYSPLHNVKQGVAYPATLITTGDHDDRVVPAHSFKFAAELQAKQTGNNPILIRIETNAGHGAGTPVSKTIEQNADLQAFTLWNMGIKTLR
ncbi:prolyl oligopeptidase family protein [Capnocytophaga sp. oral taxon 324]|uniref:prolyl oligopeptidase family serine peptidase n=1 Tax=Capnocytophaga sp. oral taxon 324 TaxID=712211 RepID=UPI0002A3BE8F|nr:prolyl oligopeptidase family serine peptidase [Capnocytophaga sp. oral taxon 324]EKY16146.1 prolyl endopeptidase [Capnocytophaga sp. oral taxon 324 str. F0483]